MDTVVPADIRAGGAPPQAVLGALENPEAARPDPTGHGNGGASLGRCVGARARSTAACSLRPGSGWAGGCEFLQL